MSLINQPVQNILIKPKRSIGNGTSQIQLQVVVSEQTTDTLTVTKQPVQMGASITDHAYLEPVSFSHSIYFSDNSITNISSVSSIFSQSANSLGQIYDKLIKLQASAVPFDIVTPKRIYKNMLMTGLTQTTDKLTENCLAIHATYQQVLLVQVLVVSAPISQQKSPKKTAATAPKSNATLLEQGIEGAKKLINDTIPSFLKAAP